MSIKFEVSADQNTVILGGTVFTATPVVGLDDNTDVCGECSFNQLSGAFCSRVPCTPKDRKDGILKKFVPAVVQAVLGNESDIDFPVEAERASEESAAQIAEGSI